MAINIDILVRVLVLLNLGLITLLLIEGRSEAVDSLESEMRTDQ